MKQIRIAAIMVALSVAVATGCSKGEQPATQAKTKEELKAEIRAEMEKELKDEIEARLLQEQAERAKQESERPETNTGKAQAQEQPPSPMQEQSAWAHPIRAGEADSHVHRLESNETARFDLDGDGKEENITYDSVNGRLEVEGHNPIEFDTMFTQKDYFIIINFKDKYDNAMNMIGIVDYGPSLDVTTALHSIIAPMGKKELFNVGTVGGEVVPPSQYDASNADDFNLKAVYHHGQGIEAPVRLSLLDTVQTWYGRNLFTYYTTYKQLIDNANIYLKDYKTNVTLQILKPVNGWQEKDTNSGHVTIQGGQSVKLIATDNKEWVRVEAQDGTKGWVKATDINHDHFSGFPMFD